MSRLLLLGAAGAGLALFFVARGKAVKAAAAAAVVPPSPAAPAPAPPVAQPTGIATPYDKLPLPGPRAPMDSAFSQTADQTAHPGYVFVNGHWERTRAPTMGLSGFGRIARPTRPALGGYAGNYRQVAKRRPPINDYGSLAHMGKGSLGGKVP